MPNLQTRAFERVSRLSADLMWSKNIFLISGFLTCSKKKKNKRKKKNTKKQPEDKKNESQDCTWKAQLHEEVSSKRSVPR